MKDKIYIADVIVYAPYRGKGYGRKALLLLCQTPSVMGCIRSLMILSNKWGAVHPWMLTVKLLSLGFWRNRRQFTEVIIFTSVGDGF